MSFSFGFSGDDVEDDDVVVGQTESAPAQAQAQSQFVGLPAEEHSLDDLVGLNIAMRFRNLPSISQIGYEDQDLFFGEVCPRLTREVQYLQGLPLRPTLNRRNA